MSSHEQSHAAICVQRCFRQRRALSQFHALGLEKQKISFESLQEQIVKKSVRFITFRFLKSLFPNRKISHRFVHITLCVFLFYHFSNDLLNNPDAPSDIERKIKFSAKKVVDHLQNQTYCCVDKLQIKIGLFEDLFKLWLNFDKEEQLKSLSDIIFQLRQTRNGDHISNEEVRQVFKRSSERFEKEVWKCIKQIGGEEGVQFVTQIVEGIEKMQTNAMNVLETKLHKTVKTIFWEMMKKRLGDKNERIPTVLQLFTDLEKTLLSIVKENDHFRFKITDCFDSALFQMKMLNGSFGLQDIKEVLQQTASLLGQLCAPIHDPEIQSVKDEIMTWFENSSNTIENIEDTCTFFMTLFLHLENIQAQMDAIQKLDNLKKPKSIK